MKNRTIIKYYENEKINKELINMLERGFTKDREEFVERLEIGEDFIILNENIDKILDYVKGGYKGELYLNSNIYWLCWDCMATVLRMFGLKLIGEETVTEHEKVVFIREDKIYKYFTEIISYLSNEEAEKLASSLLEYVNNDKEVN